LENRTLLTSWFLLEKPTAAQRIKNSRSQNFIEDNEAPLHPQRPTAGPCPKPHGLWPTPSREGYRTCVNTKDFGMLCGAGIKEALNLQQHSYEDFKSGT
jgi:hypothetical protein